MATKPCENAGPIPLPEVEILDMLCTLPAGKTVNEILSDKTAIVNFRKDGILLLYTYDDVSQIDDGFYTFGFGNDAGLFDVVFYGASAEENYIAVRVEVSEGHAATSWSCDISQASGDGINAGSPALDLSKYCSGESGNWSLAVYGRGGARTS